MRARLTGPGEPASILVRHPGIGTEAVLLGGHDPADIRYRLPSRPVENLVTGLRPGITYIVRSAVGAVEIVPGRWLRATGAGVITFRSARP